MLIFRLTFGCDSSPARNRRDIAQGLENTLWGCSGVLHRMLVARKAPFESGRLVNAIVGIKFQSFNGEVAERRGRERHRGRKIALRMGAAPRPNQGMDLVEIGHESQWRN